MNTPSHTDVSSNKEHVSRAKDPSIVEESQKPIGWISNIIRMGGILVLVVVLAVGAKSCIATERERQAADSVAATIPPVVVIPEGLVAPLPDCYTRPECEIEIRGEIHDLYTDGDSVYVLPPEWSRKEAILYSGKGHLAIRGGNIHSGKWTFWPPDRGKVVLVRPFVKKQR